MSKFHYKDTLYCIVFIYFEEFEKKIHSHMHIRVFTNNDIKCNE